MAAHLTLNNRALRVLSAPSNASKLEQREVANPPIGMAEEKRVVALNLRVAEEGISNPHVLVVRGAPRNARYITGSAGCTELRNVRVEQVSLGD